MNNLLNAKTAPRWVILLVDLAITCTSFTLSYFIIKHFEFSGILRGHFFIYTGLYALIALATFFCMRTHTGLIRYSNIQDIFRIFSAVFVISAAYPIAVKMLISRPYHIESLNIAGVVFINFFVASSLMVMMRAFIKLFYYKIKSSPFSMAEKVLIFGSDQNAILIKQAIESYNENKLLVAGFVEMRPGKINTYIEQKKVFSIAELAMAAKKKGVRKMIMTNEQLDSFHKKAVIDKCLQHGIKVLVIPPSEQWLNDKPLAKQLQELRIEDLLQREPIVINNVKISNELSGKRILITGAAGSIGSEIARQVLTYHPEMLILCDQAETALHEIQTEVEANFPGINIKIMIGSVRDYNRMQALFRDFRPQIVFHAAAYKHVPMMENHPCEAILTNVMGTKNIADLSVIHRVSMFVMVSTDKAVNPANVMGASKRLAEMYVQTLNNHAEWPRESSSYIAVKSEGESLTEVRMKTKFITTRFGNVLGSNGSVVPRFREQIQKGGPLTVTDPEVTRYFMTIPEAVQLVLEAGTMGKGGEIFIFDMGQSVKIVDLARKMIQLAGLIPEQDIKIVYTGLRPGEKLYEELLAKEEKTLLTHHEKIKIARVVAGPASVLFDIEELIGISMLGDNNKLVTKMKALIPEFKSCNSKYEKLDLPVNSNFTQDASTLLS
ncbi:polysaccharide biosynthesis protein [Flavisolibacter nicotianae]|uniref:polysaccharide biosynthesis protein n=1 Tax=Flavisolibacter nicotianae TaxID=2364882 RepID=UPI000EAFBCCC|nr:nucleoside-diphosphate sugar epimerase/dehydratase [Flavisolibacter nicotianae]